MEPLTEQTETKDISAIQQQKLLTYEEAMEVIKDATGVSGVQDVVTRFLTQGKWRSIYLLVSRFIRNLRICLFNL